MRKRVLILAVAVLVPVALGAAGATFTPVSGIAWMAQPPSGGTVKCIGGTSTGAWPPCSPDARAQIRGLNLVYRQEFQKQGAASDPLHTGDRTVVLNANIDANGRGVVWGTWRVDLDGAIGAWEGTVTGSLNGWFETAEAQVVGNGTEGVVEGMQLRLMLSYEYFPIDPHTGQPGLETITGYRIDPKGAK